MDTSRPSELSECYRALGLKPGAPFEQVKSQYRRLVRRWHPDRILDDLEGKQVAEEKMKAVNAAYRRIRIAVPVESRVRGMRPRPISSWPPEATWERPCPNCRHWMTVEGNRYVHCPACGVGFFPRNEGKPSEYDEPEPTPAELVVLTLWALTFLGARVFGPTILTLFVLATGLLLFLGTLVKRWWLESLSIEPEYRGRRPWER